MIITNIILDTAKINVVITIYPFILYIERNTLAILKDSLRILKDVTAITEKGYRYFLTSFLY